MGSQVDAADGTVVMKRMWQGRKVVQMALTKAEWKAWENQTVHCAEEWPSTRVAGELLDSWEADGCEVLWPTSADLNALARDCEQSRHGSMLAGMAAELRARARQAARDQMTSV